MISFCRKKTITRETGISITSDKVNVQTKNIQDKKNKYHEKSVNLARKYNTYEHVFI